MAAETHSKKRRDLQSIYHFIYIYSIQRKLFAEVINTLFYTVYYGIF